ncbi:precorrin-3B C(17)-methyltransferase [Pimelobacter simplex]|uniref:Cobalt-precorrin-2 C20-methyltransferase n=1 Tax=Nocardioides simplex TaxID=2045 RepID=A0A0A1DL56_NOCSI|nr:precorrin-3B C(17)-methyltransferase [Pimelobacter simplex]AIY18054.1 Cobalt-precorrin-2 C20-methyltransferase [Pimelobacter simplex]MCG8153642.1 precorrin-3B C(17)-methyltransferase [Pimelobacter simplex]GEB17116.1 precorrin-3B C(17)-methyltransferase [Pimelobacter simplex]SFN08185.1 precorrin-2 C20-methyltransferase / precorrin-3B C17-methyltransferase [Pimelobacter simplex]
MTSTRGRFLVVGIGPGDPELITRKAERLIGAAPVVAFHAGVRKESHARRIAADLIPAEAIEEELRYPVTTGATDHPGGYVGALADFYDECEARLAAHLDAGRDVVLLAEGDPLFYGSSMYLVDRFRDRFDVEVVPGVPAFAAATATVPAPLVRQNDVLTVLPGTLPEAELARRLADTDAAVIMKLGRTFPAVRSALAQAGRLDGALYVERASQPEETWLPVAEVDPAAVPYFSLIVVPGDSARPATPARMRTGALAPETVSEENPAAAELLVIGLGPGPDGWLTPEASAALAEVDHVVGYAPYVNRVPQRAGLQRHASGNTVEVDRARFALDLALRGERVAVVSGGDAGVFGMAAAVFEAAADPAHPEHAGVPVRVLPGVSAVQAVAARAGAPIGADFAVVSLSDRLKPWAVVERRLRAIAEADLVLGIYNPASRSRREQVVAMQKTLLEHRSPDTVVVVGRDVGRAEESLTVTTLGALETDSIDMKCLLIVGASTTRVEPDGTVWTPRWVD